MGCIPKWKRMRCDRSSSRKSSSSAYMPLLYSTTAGMRAEEYIENGELPENAKMMGMGAGTGDGHGGYAGTL